MLQDSARDGMKQRLVATQPATVHFCGYGRSGRETGTRKEWREADPVGDRRSFAFVPPLFFQCLLLHPVFLNYLSRPLRASLVLPTLKYAFSATLKHGWEPRQDCVLPNFFVSLVHL